VQVIAYAMLFFIFFLILTSAPRLAVMIVNRAGEKWLIAAIVLVVFLLRWGYYTVFEAFWNGQTPGKKLCKLRVIRDSGRQITFFESLTRNLIRVIDSLPGFYAIGIVTMLCNRRSKRLGDFAAGTLVVHERSPEPPLWGASASRTITAGAFAATPAPPPVADPNAVDLPADAVARLTADDLNVIDHFFARAIDIDIARRSALAERLAQQMTARMGIAMPVGVAPERILESTARILRGIRR
ncbi:MAG: RDD family protein, partial [Acidobacteriaceae bacterium]